MVGNHINPNTTFADIRVVTIYWKPHKGCLDAFLSYLNASACLFHNGKSVTSMTVHAFASSKFRVELLCCLQHYQKTQLMAQWIWYIRIMILSITSIDIHVHTAADTNANIDVINQASISTVSMQRDNACFYVLLLAHKWDGVHYIHYIENNEVFCIGSIT